MHDKNDKDIITEEATDIGTIIYQTASRTDATPIPVFAESDDGTEAWSIENARSSNENG